MEQALAALHQAGSVVDCVTLRYATTDGRVGLFLECPDALASFITGPVAAHYPNCRVTPVASLGAPPSEWETWSSELQLAPELFPILRHTQFQDLLNGTFADPVSGILRAVTLDTDVCSVAIRIVPASRRRKTGARQAVCLLDREFFRRHHRLAEFFAEHATRGRGRPFAWLLALLARQSPHPLRTPLDTSGSRLHDREADLQAASGKIGGHLRPTSSSSRTRRRASAASPSSGCATSPGRSAPSRSRGWLRFACAASAGATRDHGGTETPTEHGRCPLCA